MNRNLLFLLLLLLLSSACTSTKHLKKNEYMLTKNMVKMEDVRGTEFDHLNYLLRPEPNKKFMGILNLKTLMYAQHQPKVTKKGETKDSKFNRWLRESVGEPPVLLDTSMISTSTEQLHIAMRKIGYFNSEIDPEISLRGKDRKKAKVTYNITANKAYYIRDVKYSISIPEYRKIIILDTANSLIKKGAQYNEDILSEERTRLTSLLRDHGYFYATRSIVSIEVDTFNSHKYLDRKGNRTVSIDIHVNFKEIINRQTIENHLYQFKYDKVFVYTNFDINSDGVVPYDTVRYRSFRDKQDSTTYYFITPHVDNLLKGKESKKLKIVKDFKYKTITDVIFTKKGWLFTQSASARSFQRLNDLGNFNIINIEFIENLSARDTINKTGILDLRYKLTRRKLHSFAVEANARTDKSNLSLTYTNRNIFKGAEHFNFNIYGSLYYYDWLKKGVETKIYEEIGANLSLEFPRLFIFRQTQKIEALRYSTLIQFGINRSWLFERLMLNANLSYKWSPNHNINHNITPINIITIDSSRNSRLSLANYPKGYKDKFKKSIIISLKYIFDYLAPIKNNRHNFRLTLDFESAGMLVTGINKLANISNHNDKRWLIAGYNYATYEKGEINIRYNFKINKNNSFASRFNAGLAYPLLNSGEIPFERSFYIGGANSMRAWGFRSLGPGGYYSQNSIERSGDIKLEMNLEYRGTIYKAFKYGIFADMGNIWMTREYEGMPNADFKFNRFYKEIALGIGIGLRLDFNFFLIRLDYGVPIHDPSKPENNRWLNSSWLTKQDNGNPLWRWGQGFQFAIGHAF